MSKPTNELDINKIQPGHIHLIEANAGTGKTYAIANLFLRYILEGKSVQELLVVTFTRDATDELRGRIRARLAEARKMLDAGQAPKNADDFFACLPDEFPQGEQRQQALNNLQLALLEINAAAIYTIHAFCQQTLTDMAFSSGQAFDLEQADDYDLKLSALRDWWRRKTYPLNIDELQEFQQYLPSFDTFKQRLEPLLKAAAPKLHPAPPDDIKAAEKQLVTETEKLSGLWKEQGNDAITLMLEHKALSRTQKNGLKAQALQPVLDQLNTCLSQMPPKVPQPGWLLLIAYERLSLKKTGKNKEQFDQPIFHQAETLLNAIEHLNLTNIYLQDAQQFVREQLKQTKQRLGQLSFDDMIENLHHALINEQPTSTAFADKLCQQYPVILVDEFQDTDSQQYAIFKRIHQSSNEHTLILIGDPKQAIYGFRGGDIFTYMQARNEASQHWNLSVNWRSTAEVINSINTLFEGPNPFTYADIPYNPSLYPEKGNNKAKYLSVDNQQQTALRVESMPMIDGERIGNKGIAEARVHESVAGRIAELLQPGKAKLGDRPLQPADIAILVNEHQQGKAVREALLKHGIRAVTAGRDSIWETPETPGLLRLLEASLLPGDRPLLRQAMAGEMLNLSYQEIYTLTTDTRHWGRWVNLLTETGHRWRHFGFMAGFHYLLQGLSKALETNDTTDWLDHVADPERTMTNLLHLADILQTASREHATGEQLLAWMKHQTNVVTNEDMELRLESDAGLVKIITIHKSKGLQYPVVFVPYLWSCKDKKKSNTPIAWHQASNNGYQHLYAPIGADEGLVPAEYERLAEDIRKAYVALTRAESHCHLFMGSAGNAAGRTALAWLLSAQDTDLEQKAFEINKDTVSAEPLKDKAHIELTPPATYENNLHVAPTATNADDLQHSSFKRSLRTNWHIGSFSAMTRDTHQATRAPAATGNECFALRYPAGAHIGNFLHSLLEQLEPANNLLTQIEQMAPWLFRRYGILDDEIARDLQGISDWMHDVLHTPLDDSGLTLAALEHHKVLRELSFDMSTGLVQAEKLNALPGFDHRTLTPLQFKEFQGMLTGTIDLVFEHQGRYFIADYKSNLLGRQIEDYDPQQLSKEIINRRYNLQYLLYTLALHRHLQQRLPDYNYEKHLGGVYYLFLRAMQPEHGPRYGIYFTRPDINIITQLDNDIIGLAPEDATLDANPEEIT